MSIIQEHVNKLIIRNFANRYQSQRRVPESGTASDQRDNFFVKTSKQERWMNHLTCKAITLGQRSEDHLKSYRYNDKNTGFDTTQILDNKVTISTQPVRQSCQMVSHIPPPINKFRQGLNQCRSTSVQRHVFFQISKIGAILTLFRDRNTIQIPIVIRAKKQDLTQLHVGYLST